MKRIIIAVICLLIILGMGIIEQIYIKNTIQELNESLISLRRALEDDEDGLDEMNAVVDVWERRHRIIETIIPHNETKEIYIKISEIQGFVQSGDCQNALAVTITLLNILNYTGHLLLYLPEHIF